APPYHNWGPFAFTGATLAKLLKIKGQQVIDLQPELNASGRIKTLNVVGTKSTIPVDGATLRKSLGLRSTWSSVGVLSLTAPNAPVVYGSRVRLIGIARVLGHAMQQQQQPGTYWTVERMRHV